MWYSPCEPNKYIVNPSSPIKSIDGEFIQDVYEISICWAEKPIPTVKEIGGRIKRSADKWGITKLIDMHLYPDGRLCLYPPPEEVFLLSNDFRLENFFNRVLIPYLYYQSYFERHGREPWAGASHGVLGLLESYQRVAGDKPQPKEIAEKYLNTIKINADNDEMKKQLSLTQVKGHHLCWCKSGKKFRDCHKQALFGFNTLKRDLQ